MKTIWPTLIVGWLALIYLKSLFDGVTFISLFMFVLLGGLAIVWLPIWYNNQRINAAHRNAKFEYSKLSRTPKNNTANRTYFYILEVASTIGQPLVKIGIGGEARLRTQQKVGSLIEIIEFEDRSLAIELERMVNLELAKNRKLHPLPIHYPLKSGLSETYIDCEDARNRIERAKRKFTQKYDVDISD